jgi:hypothetical protein
MYTDPTAREHWEAGVRTLLTHPNPYTGMRLVDDPVVAVVLGFNEQEINGWSRIPDSLTAPWRTYLKTKYPTIGDLHQAWIGEQGKPLTTAESFETLPLFDKTSLWERNQRGVDAESFMTDLETEMAAWYIARLRAMGYRGLVSQFDYLKSLRQAVSRNLTDVVSMHGYHDHPTDFITPGSAQKQAGSLADAANWFRGMASTRLGDRPFLLTEYGHVYWNRYRYEEGLVVGGYSALQDYDCLMAHAAPVVLGPAAIRPFSVGLDPVGRASQVVSGYLFARADAAPAAHYANLAVTAEAYYTPAAIHGGVSSEQSYLPLVTGFGLTYSGNRPPPQVRPHRADVVLRPGGGAEVVANGVSSALVDNPDAKLGAQELFGALKAKGILPATNRTDPAAGLYESETGQILMDVRNRRLTVATPRLAGACFESLPAPVSAGPLTIVSSTRSASVTVIALDDAELPASRRILLVYATDAVNSGSEYNDEARTVLRRIGGLPVLQRTGTVHLRLASQHAGSLKAWSLGFDGSRQTPLPVTVADGAAAVTINTQALTTSPTPFFELATE